MRGFTVHEIRESERARFLDTLNRTLYKKVLLMNIDRNLTLAILNYTDRKVSISGQHEETLIVRARGLMEHRHDRFRTAHCPG
jgi:sigma-B regulation protein RsbU (phosphoserine phosphatase)